MKNKILFILSILTFIFIVSACSNTSGESKERKNEAQNLMNESSKQIEEELKNLEKDIKEEGFLVRGAVYNLKNEDEEEFPVFLYYTDKISYEGNSRGDSYTYKTWTHSGKKVYAGAEKIDNVSYYDQIKKNDLKPIVQQNEFSLDHFLQAIEE